MATDFQERPKTLVSEKTLVEEFSIDEGLSLEELMDQTLVSDLSMEFGLDQTLDVAINESQVLEKSIDKTLDSELVINGTLAFESSIDEKLSSETLKDKKLVSGLEINGTHVFEHLKDEKLVSGLAINESQVFESSVEKNPSCSGQAINDNVVSGHVLDFAVDQNLGVDEPKSDKTEVLESSKEETLVAELSVDGVPGLDETLVAESLVDGNLGVVESSMGKNLVFDLCKDKRLFDLCKDKVLGLDELAMGGTLDTESSIDRNLGVVTSLMGKPNVFKSCKDKVLGLNELDETQDFDSPLDIMMIANPSMDKNQVSKVSKVKNRVFEPSMDKSLVPYLSENKPQVAKSSIDQTLALYIPPKGKALVGESLINQPTPAEVLLDEVLLLEEDRTKVVSDGEINFFSSSELNTEEEVVAKDHLKLNSNNYDAKQSEEADISDNDIPYFWHMDERRPWWHMPMQGFFGRPQCYNPCHNWNMHGNPTHSRSTRRKKQKESSFSFFESGLPEDDPAMVGAGLCNLGNTCFLNAILQCFTHTVPLVEGLRSYNHSTHSEGNNEEFCVFCALHKHIELAITSTGKSISPIKIVENLNYISSDFQRNQQEDAHELLQCLLDKLDRSCNNLQTNDSYENLVDQLFGGRLISKLKCCNCGHCSDTFEPLIDLSLEIENVISLPSALESFTNLEKIEDEKPQFTCGGCKEKVTVEKQLMVDRAPLIAAFHLKRFKNDGSRVEKIDKHIQFPLELDLKPYTNGDQNGDVDLDYKLYAIVVHSGFSPTSGHYFCFIRSAPDIWYRLDDSQVTRVSESHVLSLDAYILFYAKKGTPWFSTFKENEKMLLDLNPSTTSPTSVFETANQSSELSFFRETNIINEVSEKDTRDAPGLSFNNSRHDDILGKDNINTEMEKISSPSSYQSDIFVLSNTSPKSEFDSSFKISKPPSVETNIGTDLNHEDRREAVEISRSSFNKDEIKKIGGNFDSVETSSPSATTCDKSVSFDTSEQLVVSNKDLIFELSSTTMETTINTDRNQEDRKKVVETSILSFSDSIYTDEVKDAGGNFESVETSSPSAIIGDKSFVLDTSQKSVIDNKDHITELSSTMETTRSTEANQEDRREVLEISRLSFIDPGYTDEVMEAVGYIETVEISSSSAIPGDKSIAFDTSQKLVIDDKDHISVSSSIIKTNWDVNEEERAGAMEISTYIVDECGQGLNQAKDDSMIETSSSSYVFVGANSNHLDGEFRGNDDLNYPTSPRFLSPNRISRSSFDDSTLGDKVDADKDDSEVETNLSRSALTAEVETKLSRSTIANSTSVSAKSCSSPRNHPLIKRRLPCKRRLSNCRQKKNIPLWRRKLQSKAAVNL